ncbi:MAG: beta strand repeat-containing protein [Flavobacteriaceae bacterium]
MIKRLLLLTAIFGFAVSCNDYEDDFANLNDQLDGVNAKLDNIQTAVDGIAGVQLELLNINSALAAISSSIADLPTVEDIAGLANLINSTSSSLAAQMTDLDSDLQAVAASIIAELGDLEDIIENGFLAVNTSLSALDANIQIIDGEISVLQTGVLDLASAVAIVDGKIVAVDNELDTLLSNLTGQLAAQLTDITAQFAAVTGEIDANQAEALIWYLNTMAGIARVEVDLEAINAQNVQVLQQLAGMLTVINDGFATQSAELTAAEQAILADIALIQTDLTQTLAKITGLEILVATIEASIDGTGGVDEQLAAINALIVTLQSDLTTLLESTTTIYQGDLNIRNQAELDYALELDDKVMVINGNVEINSTFATGAALTSLNSVITKMVTITGNVTVTSTADLDMDSLNSVGGNYSVAGFNITDSALITVGGNATLAYATDAYNEPNLVNVGGTLTITDNGSATVDFSGVTTAAGFAVSNGAAVTDVLINVDTISLGAGIVDADIANALTLSITADTTDAISIATSTSIVITGDTFDVGDVTISAAGVTSTLEDITGNILVTATGALVFAANDLGVAAVAAAGAAPAVAAAPISVALSSDGQNIDLNEVVATSFTITDTGATAANFTDLDVVSMTADTFVLNSNTVGANNEITTPNNWNVGSTSMTAKRKILFEVFLDGENDAACTTGGHVMGDLSITTTGTGAGIETHTGYVAGDLNVSGAGLVQVNTIQESTLQDFDGDGVNQNWQAVTGARNITSTGNNVSVNHKIIICDAAGAETTTYNSNAGSGGVIVSHGTVTHRAGRMGSLTITSGGSVSLRGVSTWYAGALSISGGAANAVIDFGANSQMVGPIDVDFIGSYDAANINPAAYQINYPMTISATEGINLTNVDLAGNAGSGAYTNLGNTQGATNFVPTVLTTTTGDINIVSVTSITGPFTATSTTGDILMGGITAINTPTTVSSTTGAINLAAVATIGTAADATATPAVVAAPVDVSVTSTSGAITLTALTHVESDNATLNAGTGALAAAALASHTGTAIALGGAPMELTLLASSTGSIALSGVISTDHTLDALTTFVSMTSSVPTMILPLYASGTFDITSTALTAPSIDLADLSADALAALTLTNQASDISIGAGDYPALATLAVATVAAGHDSIVLDAVDVLASATLTGKADVLQVMNNTALTTLNIAALANKGAAQTGSKVHIINNDVLTAVETGTSKMHELKIMGNAALATIDLTSYLAGGNTANDTVTAADLATVTFTLDITDNAITGTLSPVNNAGQQTTGLVSAELAPEAKLIAAHLFGFTQGTVVAQADFVGLQATANSEDQFNNTTDFSTAGGGINTAAEWALMTAN